MKKIFLLVVLFFSIITISCKKKDSVTEPVEDNSPGTTIGVQGGTIKVEEAQVTIASGTFTSDQKLNLGKTTFPVGEESDANSYAYKLENIPINFTKPIELSVTLKGSLNGDTLMAVKTASYVLTGNKIEDHIVYLRGKITNGVLTAKLENISTASFGKVNNTKAEGKFVIYFWSKINQVSYITSSGNFRINYPVFPGRVEQSTIIQLGQILDECYSFVKNLGFDLKKRTLWPMDINVVGSSGTYGTYVNSKVNMNFDYIEINKSFLNDARELKATLIHEFFHSAQTMYNPHFNFSSAVIGLWKSGYEHLWLDEAVSTWSSSKFLNDPTFVDKNYSAFYLQALSGLQSIQGDPAGYGYGMSVFIKYLVDKYGANILSTVYSKVLTNIGSYRALSFASSVSLELDWYDFVDKLLTGKADPVGFKTSDFITGTSNKKQFTELKTTEETIPLKLPSLSSELYSFVFPTQIDASKNAQITFSTTAGEICILRTGTKHDNIKKIGTSVSEFTVTGLKDLIENKDRIVVAVSNANASPLDGTRDVTFKYKFEEAYDLSKVKSVSLSLRIAANETVGGVTSPNDSYLLPKLSVDSWKGNWVMNKFICSFSATSFSSNYSNVTGSFTLTFDYTKKELSEVVYDVSYVAGGIRNVTTKIVLQNVPLSNYNTQFGSNYAFFEFIKLGDTVFPLVKEVKHKEVNIETGVITEAVMTGCNSKSQLWIKLNEF